MAETTVISQVAEILANDLFSRFLWYDTGGWNQNWKCVKEEHVVKKRARQQGLLNVDQGSATESDAGESTSHSSPIAGQAVEATKILSHPSDVVFYYDEPYRAIRTYVNTDLKSYKKGSIKPSAITAAIQSLALTMECAELSQEWQDKFVHETKSYRIVGLLFIYNHDGEYDGDFEEILSRVNEERLTLPRDSRLFVLGPRDIRWLDNVRLDLVMLRGKGVLPHEDHCSFWYPDLVRRKKIQLSARAATLEMLTGPWIILSYPDGDGAPGGYLIYFKGAGKHAEEFLYLLDHLMHYQMVRPGIAIGVRILDADDNAPAQFKRAVDEYIGNYEGQDSDLATLLRAISFDVIPQVKSQFSQVKIGMKQHG